MNKKRKMLLIETIVAISLALLATPVWGDDAWELKAYKECTNENRFLNQCLPNVSTVEVTLDTLNEDLVGMNKDKHTWKDARVRPGDNLPFASKRHVQSIQYIDITSSDRYIVTSLSDEHTNNAAIQLIKTSGFGSEEKGEGKDFTTDKIVEQRLLTDDDETAGFNHPGGSQLIGDFLFLALEDFSTRSQPATGVWKIDCDPEEPKIMFQYLIPTTDIPDDDIHQATVGVTKLVDGTYLLAACAGPDKCDGINFYKSKGTTLDADPEFVFIDRWERYGLDGLPDNEDNWDDCGPQNMNLVAQDDGAIYLVMFGGENRGIQSGPLPGCVTGAGYDDHIYGYELVMDDNYEISLEFTNKVDVMPKSYICADPLLSLDPAKELHGLNFLAGSGLWLRPDGRDTIAYLATEHYDTCGANVRYVANGEGVKAKTRWGVSSNWNQLQLLTIDNSTVTVDEGQTAVNSGNYFQFFDATLSASVGSIISDAGTWNWSWPTTDGPDDSQEVEITRKDFFFLSNSKTFDLVVNNLPPTADAGPDQVVECVYGKQIFLDATGSNDPGTDALSFQWNFLSMPFGSASHFNNPSSATPLFQPSELGLYHALVTVTDDDGATNTDDVMIEYEDTLPPQITVQPNITAECTAPHGTAVTLGNPTTTDACDACPGVTNDAPALFPLGTTAVTWNAQDGSGNQAVAVQDVTIQDTTPPDLTVSVTPSVLWPPNHKLVTVSADIHISDVCDAYTSVKLVSILSNEPDNEKKSDGNTANDIQGADLGTDDREFQLRAERRGKGSGRIYTIIYEATDASGNRTLSQSTVTVPKKSRKTLR